MLEQDLLAMGMQFHSLAADTKKDLPPSFSQLYLGQTTVILPYREVREDIHELH